MSYLCALFNRDVWSAFLVFVSAPVFSSAQGININEFSSLANRAQSLSERLNAHEALLAEILSRPDPIYPRPRVPQPKPSQPAPPAPRPIEPAPKPGTIPGGRLPAPRYDQSQLSQPKQDSDTSTQTPASQWGKPDIPLRNDGYYLAILVGNVWPLNSGSRRGSTMEFEHGSLVGVLLGRDFGTIRVEVEHDAVYYDQRDGTGSAGIHPVLFRCIFEKEVGTRVDLRAGGGAGIALAKLNDGSNSYRDGSFCYDFLLGIGTRFNRTLTMNFDYRHFLTAASDHYQHLQSNLFTASLQFDL
ncbi:hypothetical protein N9D63_06860 [Opitutales bacterium]|jgi:hypothetical protein|nr:hypothetical protein [Opitutales bacterium]